MKTLLIIGTGPRYKLPYVKKLLEEGFNIVIFVKEITWHTELPEAKTYKVDTDNIEKMYQLLENEQLTTQIDAVITLWDQDVYNVAVISKKLNLPYIPLNAARIARDKSLMRHYLIDKPYTPNFRVVENSVELKMALEKIGLPAVLKPSGAAASINVRKIDKGMSFNQILEIYNENIVIQQAVIKEYSLNPDDFRVMIFEEFIEGHEFSVEGYVQDYKYNPVGILEKMKFQFEGTFHPTGDYAPPISLSNKAVNQMHNTVDEITRIWELNNCLIHCEMKKSENRFVLVELAARAIGLSGVEIIKLAYGIDLIELDVMLKSGEKINIKPFSKPTHVVSHIINPNKVGILKKIIVPEIDKAIYTCFIIEKEGTKTIIPPQGFQHLGWVTARAETQAKAQLLLRKLVNQIEVVTD